MSSLSEERSPALDKCAAGLARHGSEGWSTRSSHARPGWSDLARPPWRSAYKGDLAERAYAVHPWLATAFCWGLKAEVRRTNVIFIHVPRTSGTSIATALYGRPVWHRSVRSYMMKSRRFFDQAESFAVLRDPFDRVISSFAYFRAGGTEDGRLQAPFAALARHLGTLDDYLAFIEDRPQLELDCVMRRQSWFVCDLRTGRPLVKTLFLFGRDGEALRGFLSRYGVTTLPRLNRSQHEPMVLSAKQRTRIEEIYRTDFELIAGLSPSESLLPERPGAPFNQPSTASGR